jgi:hypothetical protein
MNVDFKRKYFVIGFFYFIISIFLFSTETRIYWGHWKSHQSSFNVELKFKKDEMVEVKINQNPTINAKCEYVTGKTASFPFLYINWTEKVEEKENVFFEHSLYLIIGTKGKFIGVENLTIMKGFYESSKISNKEYNEDFKLYPVELICVSRY